MQPVARMTEPFPTDHRLQRFKEFESEFLNTFQDADDFVEAILSNHRTLQQNMGRIVVKLIEEWAKAGDEGRYDLRNQGTVEFAQKVRDEVLNEGVSLPYV